jgi:aryl-alcohol dehydrogenase-like predicted oxidoreductase
MDDTGLYRSISHEISQGEESMVAGALQHQNREARKVEMEHSATLGRSNLHVPRMGLGAMVWGDPRGLARLHPAQTAYGGAHGIEEERRALELSIAAGVNLVDTAAMYSMGAAERRLGELARGQDVIIATNTRPAFHSGLRTFRRSWS